MIFLLAFRSYSILICDLTSHMYSILVKIRVLFGEEVGIYNWRYHSDQFYHNCDIHLVCLPGILELVSIVEPKSLASPKEHFVMDEMVKPTHSLTRLLLPLVKF